MKKSKMSGFLILTLMVSFVLGYTLSGLLQNYKNWHVANKPTVNTAETQPRVQGDTAVVWEREYVRSNKMEVSEFTDKEKILGKTLADIKKLYQPDQGFKITWDDQTLVIHQRIDDWTPQDKTRLRLKEFQDRVAVYKGPDQNSDVLFKVTGIVFSRLPQQIRQDIQNGKYEFADEQLLNDALENLDEYN